MASSIYLWRVDRPCQLAEDSDQSFANRWRESQAIRKLFSLQACIVALAFGALLFVINWLYGESSVIGSLLGNQSLTPMPFLEG